MCILSGDGGCQVRDVHVEEKGWHDRSLWEAILEATGCWQDDYCLCFLSHIIICYTHVDREAIQDLKRTKI